MIVGVCGFIGSGKDSIADFLVREYNFSRLSFATVLKDACASIFDWDRDVLEGRTPEHRELREKTDWWWAERLNIDNFSPRWALQRIGTELFRNQFHKDIWALAVEKRLSRYTNVVISDVRFPNEIDIIKRNAGVLWRVNRGPNPEWHDDVQSIIRGRLDYREIIAEKYPTIHESEWAWIGTYFSEEIDNNGTLDGLYRNIRDCHFRYSMLQVSLRSLEVKQ